MTGDLKEIGKDLYVVMNDASTLEHVRWWAKKSFFVKLWIAVRHRIKPYHLEEIRAMYREDIEQ